MSPITVSDKSNQNVPDLRTISPSKAAKPIKKVQNKTTPQYQISTWDSLRKSITRIIYNVTPTNLKDTIRELLELNLIRGRGIFCRSVLTSQMFYPKITDVLSAVVAVINSMFFDVGQLFIRRIVWQFKRAYQRNDKPQLLNTVKFIAQLVNQQVIHEIIGIEILTVLLKNGSDDSIEVAVCFVVECGLMLQDGVFDRFRGILYEGRIDRRIQFIIEKLFAIRKGKFQRYPVVRPEFDLVEEEDKLTHEISLDEEINPEFSLDVFKFDPYFVINEKFYERMKKDLIGDDEESEGDQESGSDGESDEESEGDQATTGIVSNSDTRSSHSSDSSGSANSDENGRKRKRN